ncbi:histidine phosphatase family protein [Uliginosibacterium sp. H3]|uniref:Histidine phosphatase family protein n=1 Tax=Uliginosibacterium silvisoli TaxID=3114758 RepID=A0ABU6K0B8_9RHOO|nr:histidine phosphatase family protein [Uliginosibacterium sp. H3]
MLTRLCLIRHGETDWNVIARLQGWIDIPLNSLGMQQAAAAAATLQGRHFDALYSSDLSRTRMTAEPISAGLGLAIRSEPRLRERNLGLLQGLTPAEADAQYPAAYGRLKSRRPDYEPPGGESVDVFASRVGAVLDEVLAHHAGQSVLIVTHGGVLDMLYRLASNIPFHVERTWRLGNGALNWLQHDGTAWSVTSWDDKAHLRVAGDERAA